MSSSITESCYYVILSIDLKNSIFKSIRLFVGATYLDVLVAIDRCLHLIDGQEMI